MVRTDLTPAQQMVQAVHAAYEAGLAQPEHNFTKELDYSVILTVDSEVELLKLWERLTDLRLPVQLFRESDLDGQATALCAAPVQGDQRRAFRDLPLWTPCIEPALAL